MSKTKVLIIEDDAEISRLTAMYLDVEGYDTKLVVDGALAVAAVMEYEPDVVVLDLLLPHVSGIEICKQARVFYEGPIVVLTACDDDASEVSLLKLGADDFLSKPLKPHILVARIEALMRRVNNQLSANEHEADCRLVIDIKNQKVTLDDITLNLTHAEYEMLVLLKHNMGVPVSRDDCCHALRGIDYDFSNRSIDMRISGLRKKMHDEKNPHEFIVTIRNKGYMLINA